MKRKIAEILRNKKLAAGFTAAALALIITSVSVIRNLKMTELPIFTDPVMEVIQDTGKTPLALTPIVKTTIRKNTSAVKVTMKSTSEKTYTPTMPVVKKTTTVVSDTANKGKYSVKIARIAPLMDKRVLKAYTRLGFSVKVDSSAAYAGYFDAAARKIIIQRADDTIYHELGHFLAFISGNTDKSAAFRRVYSKEKSRYKGIHKAYVTQNSSEYFAESVKDYILRAASLKRSRPYTYKAISDALNKITDARVTRIQKVYGPVWNK